MRAVKTCLFAVLVCAAALAAAQDEGHVANMTKLKLGNVDGVPKCMTLAPVHGDPFKGAAVIAIKMTSGCTVPWHWHTATENLIFVSGKGKAEMKGSPAAMLGPGDYVYLPGKMQHEFTCVVSCTFYDSIDGAFDIHYVDKDGKEIPADQALKSGATKPAMKKSTESKKK
ncbi:MAG TPA: cupin domain-containing protein [Candidatus Limnocylindrales bacterium]|jgi:quercetin dioxygenase-like cupin family protein|nr:cupin domain-containing protein [Candidatus Limnocylindrales bacterium]